MIPNTLKECNKALDKKLSTVDRTTFKNLSKDDLAFRTHHYLGRWIRNNWGLWKNGPLYLDMKSLGFHHADDMSGTIIKEYWLYLHQLPSEVEQDLVKYNEHWNKINIIERN